MMHKIKTQIEIKGDHYLKIQLPENIEIGTYQVIIMLNPQLDPDDTPDGIIIEGIKEGLKEAITDQTIPLAQMWEDIDV